MVDDGWIAISRYPLYPGSINHTVSINYIFSSSTFTPSLTYVYTHLLRHTTPSLTQPSLTCKRTHTHTHTHHTPHRVNPYIQSESLAQRTRYPTYTAPTPSLTHLHTHTPQPPYIHIQSESLAQRTCYPI